MFTTLTLGAVTINGGRSALGPDGTGYYFKKFTGWDDSPALRFDSLQRTGSHGSTATRGYLSERTMVIEGFVHCPAGDPAKLREAVDRLTAQLPLSQDAKLVVAEPGLTRHIYVRQGGQPIIDRIGRTSGRGVIATFSLQLVALDPRRLSGDGAPAISKPLPVGTNTKISTGGRIEAPALVSLVGPFDSGASLACGGRTLTVGKAVPAGKTLTLDLERRKAFLGSTDISVSCTGLWPAPSVDDRTFKLTATGTGSATITAWEAWA